MRGGLAAAGPAQGGLQSGIEDSLGIVITRLQAQGLKRIRVVYNGSHDHTAEIARQRGAEVISELKRGYGQACWTGCNGLPPDVEWILFRNADGSDDIQRVPALLTATESSAEFILGKRTTGIDGQDHLTTSQRIGNKFAVASIRLLWGAKYADLGPLRLISRKAFERMNLHDRGFWLDGGNAGPGCGGRSVLHRSAGAKLPALGGCV